MAYKGFVVGLGIIFVTSPVSATQPELTREGGAPAAAADARYCLRVEPVTGSRIETIRCETREGWAELDVDVDQEWAEWGVRVVTSPPQNT